MELAGRRPRGRAARRLMEVVNKVIECDAVREQDAAD